MRNLINVAFSRFVFKLCLNLQLLHIIIIIFFFLSWRGFPPGHKVGHNTLLLP